MTDIVPLLQGRNLSRTYGQGELMTHAMQDVSLDLLPGQVTLLMGPSGSGKSTLLAVLGGLLRPHGGRVQTLGADLWQVSEREREQFRQRYFGFIFQGCNLLSSLTAKQQLEIVLRWGQGASSRAARREAEAMLAELDLPTKHHLRPGQLSGGEKQRIAVGRALIKKPRICFADEPTSALDWQHGEQVVQLLRAAATQHGATVFIVSHDARIIPFVDQVLHMEDGRLDEAAAHPRLEESLS